MVVGELIRIQGTIEGDDELIVRGRIEGVVRIGGALIVEAGGWVMADVSAREVTVHGTVRGNVSAREGIEIARTGRMIGDATAPRVTIASGAGFRGRVEMGDLSSVEEPPPLRTARPLPETPAAPLQSAAAPQQSVAAPQQAAAAPQQAAVTPKQVAPAPQRVSAAVQQVAPAPQRAAIVSRPSVAAAQPAAAVAAATALRTIPSLARPTSTLKRRTDA